MMSFAARLRAAIKSAGISVPALAAKTGIPRQTIYYLLDRQRSRDPQWSTVCALADALGVKLDSLR